MNDDILNQSLQELYETAPCGYVFALPDGRLIRVNDTFLSWTGYSRDEILARRFQDLLTLPGKMFYENQYAPLLRMQGEVQEVAFDLLRRDGSRLPVLVNSALRMNPEGNPVLVISTIFSAVERRAYEQELLRARMRAEHLAEVMTASSDAIITCTVDGAVQYWNASAEHLFGYDGAAFPTLILRDLLPFGGEVGYERTLQPLWGAKPVRVDTVAVHAGGESIDVSVSITPHTDQLGAVSSLSVIVRDIRERRALERLQQEFLAMASHELRTPLAAIRGHAQLMQRRQAYRESSVEIIVAQTRQLTQLIDDLLLASQIEADRLVLRILNVDLIEIAQLAIAASAVGSDHRIRLDAPAEPIPIRADGQRLNQALANLVANAVKYSPNGGEITVRIRKVGSTVCIEVRDEGIGIGPDDLPHLFQRFYRAPDVAQTTKGTGLGLYITRRIVEEHGGRIDVESDVGRGSTFTVTLPLISEQPPLHEPAPPSSPGC